MDYINITSEEIDVNSALSVLSDPSCGGTAFFLGTTRDNFDGKKVNQLKYEAYESMAIKYLEKVAHEMKTKWSVEHVVLVHRIGIVPIASASVLVATSSAHRKDALEAVSYGIDAIKNFVPIWKKEEYEDGSYSWKQNCECN